MLTLTLKPAGRGNWNALTLVVDGQRATPLLIRVGQTLSLGGIVFRISSIKP